MIIGIDARFAIGKRRGIGNYVLALIKNLAMIDNQNQYVLYVDRDDIERVLPHKDNFLVIKMQPSNYAIWEQVLLPRQAINDNLDILHCTGNTAPYFLDKDIKMIVTIHDIMYLKKANEVPRPKNLYQRFGRLYRRYVVPNIIYKADKIIAVSNFSKVDIRKQFSKLLSSDIQVIYEAADRKFKKIESEEIEKVKKIFNIRGNYIFALGAIDPRKNTEFILKNYIEIKTKYKLDVKLVITGIPDWQHTKYYNLWNHTEFKGDIIFTPFVKEFELVALYNGAILFLYPSLYEGFGLPLLEAMACGTPVITSNVTSIPEIVNDAAILINPSEGKNMQQAILDVINNNKLRKHLINLSFSQAERYSWEKTAQETLKVYEKIYSS